MDRGQPLQDLWSGGIGGRAVALLVVGPLVLGTTASLAGLALEHRADRPT